MKHTETGKKLAIASKYIGIASICLILIAVIIIKYYGHPVFMIFTVIALILSIIGLTFGTIRLKSPFKDIAMTGVILSTLTLAMIVGLVIFITLILIFYPKI